MLSTISVVIVGPRWWAVLDTFSPTTTSGCLAEPPSLLHWQLLSPFGVASCSSSSTALLFLVWATTLTWMLFAFDPHSLALGHFLVLCRNADLSSGFLGSSFNAKKASAVTTYIVPCPLWWELTPQPYWWDLLTLSVSSLFEIQIAGQRHSSFPQSWAAAERGFLHLGKIFPFSDFFFFHLTNSSLKLSSFSFLTTSCLQPAVRRGNSTKTRSSAGCGRKG